MRSILISVIAISLIGAATGAASQIALAKQSYTLQQYPDGFADANIPCSAFKRTSDGGWKEAAVFVFRGQRFTGNTYAPGSREAGILNQKCGPR
jgi:hypothetical protein